MIVGTILVGNKGSILWVDELIVDNEDKQILHINNGAWKGIYHNGRVTHHKNEHFTIHPLTSSLYNEAKKTYEKNKSNCCSDIYQYVIGDFMEKLNEQGESK